MHKEKHVPDNIISTLLDMKGKMKDNYEVWLNLEEMGLRSELHPVHTYPNKTFLPAACFTMSNKEKYDFLTKLANVKVQDRCAPNVSRCVKLKECCIRGLKIHDSHILMQQLMLIALHEPSLKKVIKRVVFIFQRDLLQNIVIRRFGSPWRLIPHFVRFWKSLPTRIYPIERYTKIH